MPEATSFPASGCDASRGCLGCRLDLLAATAVRMRAGNANIALRAPSEPEPPPTPEIEPQLVYTLNPLHWNSPCGSA
jgi:hypothetical protein